MRQVIWKFPLRVADRQNVEMPFGARILSAQMQHGTPILWALCDADAEMRPRRFVMFGSGQEILPEHDAGEYVGTVQSFHFVWHIFEART